MSDIRLSCTHCGTHVIVSRAFSHHGHCSVCNSDELTPVATEAGLNSMRVPPVSAIDAFARVRGTAPGAGTTELGPWFGP